MLDRIPHVSDASVYRSWIGCVESVRGKLLLGGVREVYSSRFGSYENATAWVYAMTRMDVQRNAGAGAIYASMDAPEIPPQ